MTQLEETRGGEMGYTHFVQNRQEIVVLGRVWVLQDLQLEEQNLKEQQPGEQNPQRKMDFLECRFP